MQYAPTRVREKSVRFHISVSGHAQNAPNFTLPNKDTPKNRPVLDANPWRRTFRGVCNTPLHVYAQNPPDFTLPNKDTPKTCPVLDPNLWRGTFGGVCNTPLHGYVQNLTGFIFPHLNTPKTHPISPSPIRIRQKRTRFYTQTVVEGHFGAYAFAPYMGTCKIWRVSYFRTRICQKRTRFHPSQ